MIEHRSSTRGLFDKLQLPENVDAREFLERLLDDPTRTYDEICISCKSSGLFEDIKDITPQDLSRYRQRRAREAQRDTVMSLIEADAETIIDAAAKNRGGVLAKYLRSQLAEHAIARFDAELDVIDAISVSRETARHALVEQRDRKLDLDADKLRIEEKRLEFQRQQQELHKDKFDIAAKVYQFVLGWLANKEPKVADVITQHSDELLTDLEGYIEANA